LPAFAQCSHGLPLIACVGLYGMVSFNVAQRTKEIGNSRSAGRHRPNVIWLVLREVLGLAICGLRLGIPIMFWGSRLLKSFLYGIQANDAARLCSRSRTVQELNLIEMIGV